MELPAFRELPADGRVRQRALLVAQVEAGRRLGLLSRNRILVVVTAAVAVALGIALMPERVAQQRGDVLQLALAAVSEGPVIHAVVENSESKAILLDLESGKETVEPERHEYWYDERRGDIHARLTVGREVLNEFSGSQKGGPPPAHRALAFATHYREALESGKARVVRRETIDGRKTFLLRIDIPAWTEPRSGEVVQPGYVEEVSVDADTFKPLRFRHLPGPDTAAGPIQWWRVVSIESIERVDRHFRKANLPRFRMVAPSNDKKVSVDEAATALGRTALWPGTRVAEAELDRIGLVTTTITWADHRETKTPSLLIRYGRDLEPGSKDWIWLSVGPPGQAEISRWGPYDGETVPAGKVRLAFVESRDDRSVDMWFGNVERDGLYIDMQSPRRDLIVAAANTLHPIG